MAEIGNSVVPLPLLTCVLYINHSINNFVNNEFDCGGGQCISCPINTTFLYSPDGQGDGFVSKIIVSITAIIGAISFFLNAIHLNKIGKEPEPRAKLGPWAVTLLCIDIVCSSSSVAASFFAFSILDGGDTSITEVGLTYGAILIAFLARTASYMLTSFVLLKWIYVLACEISPDPSTIEPKLKIGSGKLFASGLALFLSFPRVLSHAIVANPFEAIPSLSQVAYLIMPTPFHSFWYETMGAYFDKIDFYSTLPLILSLQMILCYQMRDFTGAMREERFPFHIYPNMMTYEHLKLVTLNAVLFTILPFYFACSVGGSAVGKEIFLALFLGITINSLLNVLIFRYKLKELKEELKAMAFAMIVFRDLLAPHDELDELDEEDSAV